MSFRHSAVLAGLVGVLVIALIASFLGLPRDELAELVLVAGGAALVTGVLGGVTLQLLRGRSFTAQVVVVALTSTSAVTAGALAGGNAMFFTVHDLQVLAIVVAIGAVISVISALVLGERVGAASRSLGEVARRLGDPGSTLEEVVDAPMPENLIAEFRRLADQLERTRRELEASREREQATDRARRELVSWVSHDLRTPLAGIRAIAELLEDGLVEDAAEVRQYYASLRRETDRLAGLVQDLFEVSRIEAGALRIDPVHIDLEALVEETLAGVAPVAEQRGIRVYGRVEPGATVLGGRPELSRVLGNLVTNAVRESADGGAVLVEAGVWADAGATAFLAVQDTCGGIPAEVMQRMFEPSYRGESARTPIGEGGGGLGLAIAHGFVAAHGGTISVDNVAEGCRFEVTLPQSDVVVRGQADVPVPPGGDGPSPGGRGQGDVPRGLVQQAGEST